MKGEVGREGEERRREKQVEERMGGVEGLITMMDIKNTFDEVGRKRVENEGGKTKVNETGF